MTTRHRYQLLTSLVALMALMSAESQAAQQMPRLVVNIVVDQLRSDCMEAFSGMYGEKGFNRLLSEARVYGQVEYPFSQTDRASAVATLMSGATPYEHGIIASRWLDRATLCPKHSVDDPLYAPFGVSENGSAVNLAVSTLSDEMKVASGGKAYVYSVSPFREAAILSAGHAADGAFWISDQTGEWTGTSYYGKAPQWFSAYDATDPTTMRIDKAVWQPLAATEQEEKRGGKTSYFKYPFKGSSRFRDFKTSGLINEEVNRLALHCVREAGLGLDDVADLLNITYYAGNYQHSMATERPQELIDIYRRLDIALGEMMEQIEQQVGKDNVLFVLTSTGYADDNSADLSQYRVPTGQFSINKAQMLLNMYLVAVYGEGQYVEASMGNQLYLNQKLIEQRGLNMAELLERCQDFLIQMAGVRDVFTSRRLALASADRIINRMRNGYNPRCSGDILVQVAPGWHLVNDNMQEDRIIRDSYLNFPLFFLGPNVKAEKIETPVTIDQVAPTIAKSIRIRAPNGCSSRPLF